MGIGSKTISGYAQKGPFKAGSVVDIYELELDGKTFAQTGKSFTGKVANDKGEFKIPNVSLKSQYALLKVTGYFTSEINGEGVRATLTAVTDLSKRENVNVNILTHLEYDRVLALLGKGMNFTSAKKQAGREVLAAFGIGLEENAAAEDLNVSGENDADAALVAISKILLAGKEKGTNRNEESLSGLLANIAGSIGENGTWDGNRSIAERISNIAYVDWGLWWEGDECRFKKSYRNEYREISLPPIANLYYQIFISWFYFPFSREKFCTSSLDGKVLSSNAYSKDSDDDEFHWERGVNNIYLCKDGYWHYIGKSISDGDSVTQEWCDNFIENFSRGKDGEIRKGDITGLDYKYDEKMGKWRRIDSRDTLFSTVCTLNHVGELIENVIDTLTFVHETYFDTVTYVCDENGWREIAVAEENFGATCTDKNRGLCKHFGDSVFCCDSSGWRKANYGEDAFEEEVLEICNLDGKIMKGLDGNQYECIVETYNSSCVDIFGVDTCNYHSYWDRLYKLDSLFCSINDNQCKSGTVRECKSGTVYYFRRNFGWWAKACDLADSSKLRNLQESGYIKNFVIIPPCGTSRYEEECPIEL